jgi:hypothetical protein
LCYLNYTEDINNGASYRTSWSTNERRAFITKTKRSALKAILDENTQQVDNQPGTSAENKNFGFNFGSYFGDFGESPGDVTFVDELGIVKIGPDEVGHDGKIVIESGCECLDDSVLVEW